jgi:hypothetical protein
MTVSGEKRRLGVRQIAIDVELHLSGPVVVTLPQAVAM